MIKQNSKINLLNDLQQKRKLASQELIRLQNETQNKSRTLAEKQKKLQDIKDAQVDITNKNKLEKERTAALIQDILQI